MSKFLMKLKLILVEQIWLIALITPLLVLAILGLMNYKKNHDNHLNNSQILLSDVQLSPVKLAGIVAKPLGELLQIKVYFDNESSIENALLAQVTTQEIATWTEVNAILPNLPRRNRMLVLTYVSTCGSRRNQAVTG